MNKRIISILLSVCMLVSGTVFANIEANDAESESLFEATADTAYMIFGEDVKLHNVSAYHIGPDGDKKIIEKKGGREAWTMGVNTASNRFGITLSDEFKSGVNKGDIYEIEVDYFDTEKDAFFWLGFDSVVPQRMGEDWPERSEDRIVYTTGSKLWKTEKFTVTQAAFEKRLTPGGSDIVLMLRTVISDRGDDRNYTTPTPIPFGAIRVKRIKDANPVRVTAATNMPGNSYKWFEESKTITNTLTNLKGVGVTATVTYSLESLEGVVGITETKTIGLGPYETITDVWDFGKLKRCDIYNYYVSVSTYEFSSDTRVHLSQIAVLKTDPDGIRNEKMYNNLQVERRGGVNHNINEAVAVFALGNFEGIRLEMSEGSLKGNSLYKNQKQMLDELKKYGMSMISLGTYSAPNSPSWDVNASTSAEFEKLSEMYLEMVDEYKDYTQFWEGDNEPDYAPLNRIFDLDDLWEGIKIQYNAVQQKDPGAMVGIIGWCGWGSNTLYKTQGLIDRGVIDILRGNAFVVHGYYAGTPEFYQRVPMIQEHVDLLTQNGLSPDEYEIWMTEYGHTTKDGYIQTHRRQGAYTMRETTDLEFGLGVDKFVIYNFEAKGEIDTNREARFGTASPASDESARYGAICIPYESFVMSTAYNYLFAQSEPVKYIVKNSDVIAGLYKSNKFDKDLMVMNSITDGQSLTLDLGAKQVSFFDEYGNETILESENGIYDFHLNYCPYYVMGDFGEVKVVSKHSFETDYEISVAENDIFEIEISNNTNKNYTVEFEASAYAKPISGKELKKGKNKFTFESTISDGKTGYLWAYIKDGSKIVSKILITMTGVSAIKESISILPRSLTDLTKWQAVVNIDNNSLMMAQKGTIELLTDKFSSNGEVSFGYIPRGTTAEIRIDLPDIQKKQIDTLEYIIKLDSGTQFKSEQIVDLTVAPYAVAKPVIDGKISNTEWNFGTEMSSDSEDKVVLLDNFKWNGPEDLSLKGYTMWDEEYIYLAFDVTDDTFYNTFTPDRLYNGDNIQFGIYVAEDYEHIIGGQGGSNFNEVSMGKGKEECAAYRHSVQHSDLHNTGLLPENSYNAASERIGNHTYYEIKVKWSELIQPDQKIGEGTKIGFSYLANDNDGEGRKGAMLYADGIFSGKSTSKFVFMTLLDKPGKK